MAEVKFSEFTAIETAPDGSTTALVGLHDHGSGTVNSYILWSWLLHFLKASLGEVLTLTDAATITTECALNENFTVTLGDNRTLDEPDNAQAGRVYRWVIKQDGTGNRTLAYHAAFKFAGGSDPVLSTAANSIDVLVCFYDGTNWLCDIAKNFA